MATVNKSERKQLVGTSVVRDSITVFARKDTGEEFARVDVMALTPEMQLQCMLYGVKQVVADCVSAAEGIDFSQRGEEPRVYRDYSQKLHYGLSPIGSYRTLWESINGPGSWEANECVRVVEFKRIG